MDSPWILLMSVLSVFVMPLYADVVDTSPIFIDCGNVVDMVTDEHNNVWSTDAYNTDGSGLAYTISNKNSNLLTEVEKTLRSWDTGDSCYDIPVKPGRYLVRLGFAFDFDEGFSDYSNSKMFPIFSISLESTIVKQLSNFSKDPVYYDFAIYVLDETLTACFTPLNNLPTFVNSIMVTPLDSIGYYSLDIGNSTLSNWARVNSGGDAFGLSKDEDEMYRYWAADYPTPGYEWISIVPSVNATITIDETYHFNHLPPRLFNTCREAVGNSTGYNITGIYPVNPDNNFLVILYFVEYNMTIFAGERAMDVDVNGVKDSVAILSQDAGSPNTGFMLKMIAPIKGPVLSDEGGYISINVSKSETAEFPPILCGLEVYEIINSTSSVINNAKDVEIRIDCGGRANFTDDYGFDWVGDMGYSSGNASITNSNSSLLERQTLRYFPYPKKNCYRIDLALKASPDSDPRYFVRLFFDYASYNVVNGSRPLAPTFNVSLQGTQVSTISTNKTSKYLDAITYVTDNTLEVCLLDNQIDSPTIISSIEIFDVGSGLYSNKSLGTDSIDIILYNYYRINCGGDDFGEFYTPPSKYGPSDSSFDPIHRQWTSDLKTLGVEIVDESNQYGNTSSIKNIDFNKYPESPNYFPSEIYRSARVNQNNASEGGADILAYNFTNLHPGAELLLVLHFIELKSDIQAGERIFDIALLFENETRVNISRDVDIAKDVGILKPKTFFYRFKINSNEKSIELRLKRPNDGAMDGIYKDNIYSPMISAIELYRVLKINPLTIPSEVDAMEALREALEVGEELNWQGDPCIPAPWDGVKCLPSTDDTFKGYSTVTRIELPGKSLRGYIPQAVSELKGLIKLDLSDNQIRGAIPDELGSMEIEDINLSHNLINGSIPDSFWANQRLRTLNLSSMALSGEVPDISTSNPDLQLDVSGNPLLCGYSLTDCSSIQYPPPPDSTSPSSPPPKSTPSPSPDAQGKKDEKSRSPIVPIIIVIVVIGFVALVVGGFFYYHRHRDYIPTASSDMPSTSNTNIFGARRKASKTHGFYILERGRAANTSKEGWNMSNIV